MKRGAWVLGALVALAGCAARPPEAMSPMAASQAAPPPADAAPAREPEMSVTSIDESDPVAALAEAEGTLDRALAQAGAGREAPPAGGAPKEPRAEGATAPGADAGDGCEVACRALASMRRSAARLCGLASGDDAVRCDDARARVARAEKRVEEGCPACPAQPGDDRR